MRHPNHGSGNKGIVGSLKPGIKFSTDDGQVYEVIDHKEGRTVAVHISSGVSYDFASHKLVTPHVTLLYSSGV
jgi:hypothetical protein